MVKNYKFLTLKFVLINERESKRKLPKMFPDKNLRMTQKKASGDDLIKKKACRGVLKKDACAAAKHKIILSWPKKSYILQLP